MGCMLRSDLMTQCDMFLQPDPAFMVISQLGREGCVQFTDMNEGATAFHRTYVHEICRISETERKLRYIGEKMKEDEIYVPKLTDDPPPLELHEMNTFETLVEKWERIILEMSTNQINLKKSHAELREMSFMMTNIGPMLGNADVRTANLGTFKNMVKGTKPSPAHHVPTEDIGGRLTVITGLVQRKRSYSFQLMLWRLSRGCALYRQSDEDDIFKDPINNSDVRKVAFLLVVQGEELGTRMKKVCDGFHCDLYPMPPTAPQRVKTLMDIDLRVLDLNVILSETKVQRCKAMRGMARLHPELTMKLKKAKAIYHILNFFTVDISKNCLIGRCWIPTVDLKKVQDILDKCTEKMETSVNCFISKIKTHEIPPTFHRTNKFTYGFQALISAYGDSRYRELNPGLYTIISFPFLFAMMFGDMGHGTIMLSAALWMVLNEKKFMAERSDSEIWNIFFGGRYIMLLMAIFSICAGFIYNDCFSKGFTIFKSGWSINKTIQELTQQETFLLEPGDHSHAYIIGKDPLWEGAKNKILFENSLKMKLSIIIGVTHMIFGVSLSFFNDIFFKRHKYLIFLEFLPRVLFLICIFFWLVFLIFFKWFKYGGASPNSVKESQGCAPLVLILFIDMMLMSTSKPVNPECDAYMFPTQHSMQQALLAIALISVPIMLFGPPCYAAQMEKKRRKFLQKKVPNKEYDPTGYAEWEFQMNKAGHHFGDLMIHASVETIEFVLSTISHTASYLRLWALSLAHAQLSEMLWSMIFAKMALTDHTLLGSIKIVGVFIVWGVFTIAILVLMEGLSAFLHTLRLHWVEFMSKFFVGNGVMFKPFFLEDLYYETGKEKMEVCPTPKVFEY